MTPSTVTDYVIISLLNVSNITKTTIDGVAMTTTTSMTDSAAAMVAMVAMGDGNHLTEVVVKVAVEEAMVADEKLKGIVI